MNCPSKEQLLESTGAVATHLEVCVRCRQWVEGLSLMEAACQQNHGRCLPESTLMDFHARRLSAPEQEKAELHLSNCSDCLEDLSVLSEVPEAIPFSEERIRKIAAPTARRSRRSRRTVYRHRKRQAASPILPIAIAAGILAVVLGLALAMSGGDEHIESTRVAEQEENVPVVVPKKKEIPKKKEEPKPVIEVPKEVPKEEPKKEVIPDKKKPEPIIPEPKKKEEKPSTQPEELPQPTEIVKAKPPVLELHGIIGQIFVDGTLQEGGFSLHDDHVITTSHRGPASFFVDKHKITLRPESKVAFQSKAKEVVAKLSLGEAYFQIEKGKRRFRVAAAQADTLVTGTAFSVREEKRKTIIVVVEGTVEFKNKRGQVTVKANQRSVASNGRAPTRPKRIAPSAEPLIAWTKRPDLLQTKNPFIEVRPGRNKKFVGTVVVAPYADRESGAGQIAWELAESMDLPLLLGHQYRNQERWINIDRGTEGRLGTSNVKSTHYSRSIYDLYRNGLNEATGLHKKQPMKQIFTFRNHSDRINGELMPVCEVAHFGYSRKELERIKAKLNQLSEGIEFRFDDLDDHYPVGGTNRKFKYTEGSAKTSGYLNAAVCRRALTFFFPSTGIDAKTYATVIQKLLTESR